MRLIKRFEIDGTERTLIGDYAAVGLNQVGSGWFDVLDDGSAPAPVAQQRADYWIGWAGGELQPLLRGFVTETRQQDARIFRVIVRDWSAALDVPLGLALRHVVAADVLAALTEASGVPFSLPEGATYLDTLLPYFASRGTCRTALDLLGPSLGLDEPIWFQQRDGRVYWGEWADALPDAEPMVFDPALIMERDPEARAVSIPIVPSLRPGQVANAGEDFLIRRVICSGARMRLEWDG